MNETFLPRSIMAISFYAVYGAGLDRSCEDSFVLHVYFVGLVVFLVTTALLEFAISSISMKGTMADSTARKSLPVLLYIRLAIAIPEVGWNAYGTWCAFDAAELCHGNVVRLAKGTVIAGWIVFIIAVITLLVVMNLYGGKYKSQSRAPARTFKRASRRTFKRTATWEKRYLSCTISITECLSIL